jgi:hypothetical protein
MSIPMSIPFEHDFPVKIRKIENGFLVNVKGLDFFAADLIGMLEILKINWVD